MVEIPGEIDFLYAAEFFILNDEDYLLLVLICGSNNTGGVVVECLPSNSGARVRFLIGSGILIPTLELGVCPVCILSCVRDPANCRIQELSTCALSSVCD